MLNEVIDFAKKQLARCLVTLDISKMLKATFKRKKVIAKLYVFKRKWFEANRHLHILFCFRKIYNLFFIAN